MLPLQVRVDLGAYPFIAILPSSTLARTGSTWKGPMYGQMELFDIESDSKQMTCSTELFEIELFDHLTVRKEMADVWSSC